MRRGSDLLPEVGWRGLQRMDIILSMYATRFPSASGLVPHKIVYKKLYVVKINCAYVFYWLLGLLRDSGVSHVCAYGLPVVMVSSPVGVRDRSVGRSC